MSRVLVVDDDQAVVRALRRVLVGAGFQVDTAEDSLVGRGLMLAGKYSVVLSDEKMPNGRGVDFLADCARDFPEVSRILLTGYADPQIAAEAINRGEIFRLLFKPWSDLELVATVRQAAWRHALVVEERQTSPDSIQEKKPEEPVDGFPPSLPRA